MVESRSFEKWGISKINLLKHPCKIFLEYAYDILLYFKLTKKKSQKIKNNKLHQVNFFKILKYNRNLYIFKMIKSVRFDPNPLFVSNTRHIYKK